MTNDPEKWEAADHIENLKRPCSDDARCPNCDDLRRAVVWIIRHMERQEKKDGPAGFMLDLFKQSPIAGAIVFASFVAGKIHGIF